ncbi:peptidoglycan-binding protein [Polyangium spumosum]|uniref:Peptidoglycan DD-metalloendopeptidase family protein n=1 Tax=Polyangium spumosum TaxID=889282 RepID=A0A6N7PVL0_9BACT|nr:peptidoglycan-binding protein [Polyangium spumosum]MRG95567.1 peptidoglycan DD-metalloendopeptidase family protein [Polyangium spumosum]
MYPTLRLSAGYADKSPHLRDEVKVLQRALVGWGFDVKPDGQFGPGTERAVRSFQRRQGLVPDDGIVGPKTWAALMQKKSTPVGTSVRDTPIITGSECFPLSKLPTSNWTSPPRSFGSRRSGGARAHAGCDLYASLGTWVHAIADGEVILGPYPFYCETYALEVHHGSFVIRYGEIQKFTTVKQGDKVKAGQRIAKVGHLVGIKVPSDMLHLEMYKGDVSGPLTQRSGGAKTESGASYQRRADLMDPTAHLHRWSSNLPHD